MISIEMLCEKREMLLLNGIPFIRSSLAQILSKLKFSLTYLPLSVDELNEIVLETLSLVNSFDKMKKFGAGMESLMFKAHPGVVKMVNALTAFRDGCVAPRGIMDSVELCASIRYSSGPP